MRLFRATRIIVLLLVLIVVGGTAWLDKWQARSWDRPLMVGVYPINADGGQDTADFIGRLREKDFDDVEAWIADQAGRYGVNITQPVVIHLGQPVDDRPPPPPVERNVPAIVLWSLEFRYWAWRAMSDQPGPRQTVKLFLMYADPDTHEVLPDSLGLQSGMLGIVHGFSARTMIRRNNVVLAHELLHTVGATDKYDPATNLPVFPQGYADPDRSPLLPQRRAEIMGGRVPVSPLAAEIPPSLKKVVVGPATAHEVGWPGGAAPSAGTAEGGR